MEQIARIERPGLWTRIFFRIGERMFGQVPTPERMMAHRLLPLMLGLGGLWRHRVVRKNRCSASRIAQRASGHALWGALLNGHPPRRRRESGCSGKQTR
jgi:hypothetical protein